MRLITNNEIACHSLESAQCMQELLLQEGYVCMMSVEENLYILNYVLGNWDSYAEQARADRNAVVFLDRDTFEEEWFNRENIDG